MLDYLPIFPELLEALEEFDDAQVGRLLRAAAVYAFSGVEPDFAPGSPERFAWRFIRQRVDAAAMKREKKAAAGAQGGRPKKAEESTEKQTKATESTEKQTEATESLQSQEQSQAQEQEQGTPSPVIPEREHTHREQPEGSAGARAGAGQGSLGGDRVNGETVPAGWYDPEHPDRPCDASWLGSDAARKSIAQRILDYVTRHKVITLQAINAESGRVIGREIMGALQAAMAAGKSPGECQRLAQDARALWVWEIRLKEAALEYGTAPPGMAAAWREDVAELAGEAEEVALYG